MSYYEMCFKYDTSSNKLSRGSYKVRIKKAYDERTKERETVRKMSELERVLARE